MRLLAFAALVLTGLAASAALAAAPQPTWTAKGLVTALNAHAITFNGRKCQITMASPSRATIRLYFVGASAKIACADGVLRKIDVFKTLPAITSGPPTLKPTSSGFGSASVSISQTGVIAATSGAFTIAAVPISAIGNGSITVGTGPVNLMCTIGDGSPDISGFQVGDRVTNMQCRNGVLTSITRASPS